MANYTSTANVVLSVNGKQAQKMLSTLEKDAQRLEKQLAKAATAGDKATMKKLQRELNSTNNLIKQMQGSAKTTEQVLSRLDKASPKELQKALRTLQQQLNGIERGSAAWNAHVAKIQAVKAEIAKLNASLATQKTMWERMNTWLNNCQTALLGVIAAVSGLIMAGRKAVNAYAEMDEQLANTRKYTGMAAEQVEVLNEAFKRMDTRTPRAKLNELAQEAGRLGLNTLEAVQGYVEAADIINVALVDLGSGATQTIAKLTNIFGVQEMLGVKESMLAVGSTVNVLSQNCTASKPYLVEFAQRMAGIGSQAGLTIPQILAFGAVLDANGQKVEMSATAIQKVIMNLANKNQEFAKTLGLDAELLNATLKNSAKDGLLMFLQALHDIGEASDYENATMILAPAFKEMGLDAARVSQVLSTLAKHIDEVKWQMGEADKAFREATSATKEYEIFNNTAQAAIDKAKKRVSELAIELGEKLYPIMKHIYTSSGIFLRVLNTIVSFLIEYRRVIVPLVAAIASYYATIAVAKVAQLAWNAVLLSGKTIVSAFRYVVGLCDVAIIALTKGTKAAGTAITFLNQSMKASPWGLIISAVVALGVGIYNLTQKFKQQRAEEEKARKEMEEYKKSLTDLSEAAAQSAANEMSRVEALYKTAVDEAKSKDERRKAAERLQKLYPDYFKNLSTEEIMVGKAKTQYNNLRDAIIEVARARAAAAKIEENEKELLTLEQQAPALKAKMEADQRAHDAAVADWNRAREQENNIAYTNSTDAAAGGIVNVTPYANKVASTGATLNASRSAYNANITKQRQLNEANEYLRQKYNVSEAAIADAGGVGDVNIPNGGGAGGGGSHSAADRFAAEQQWREREEASARIAYATGKKDYLAYTAEMDRIAVEFYERQLLHTDLSEDERLQITAKWREAQMKQQQHADAALLSQSVDAENDRYNAQMAEVKQFYIDGQISKETYDQRIEEYEILHQQNLSKIYAEGSKERLQAEQQLQSLLIAQMQRRQRETEEHERKLASMKKEFFGDNPQERQAKYDADVALLQTVYDREIAAAGDNADEKLHIEEAFQQAKLALQKRYGLLSEEDERNRMQRAIADSVEWLNGDGGKAMQGAISTLTSGMGAIFSSLSSLIQAELEIETAAIEKRYDKEISAAEGNSYKVKKLEAQKERDIAKAKNEANRKMFAMQVIQAVAQTAQNAISAYGSAAAIPVIGYILAPIAAGMAVAAGMIQIAAIKKQQQASEAQGYSAGGFTPDGDKDEPVGIVHAGEWVASQKLVKSPKTRPIIEALEYAQRTNTIGSLAAADVSRSITAPMLLASQPQSPQIVVNQSTPNVVVEQNSEYVETMRRLSQRLDEPFVTVATVTGDKGINKAQDDYERLLRNKSPKTRK